MKISELFRNLSRTKFAAIFVPLALMIGAPVQAGFIQIDFGAAISNDGGTTIDNITGQFRLDDSVFFGVDAGGVDGVILEADFTSSMFGSATASDDAFTFASAAQRTGYGTLSLVGDYGAGLFVLDLSSDDFFPTSNAMDVLAPGLNVSGLRSFDPNALDTTQFANLVGYADEWRGSLTFMDIRAVPEPGILVLFGLGLVGIVIARRRQV